ncbi:MAG TPA: paraquat-inducible protein A [Planctomycetota bacterium]|nr:paraquat-inducible protein A [Planctomycetota bacterium]
MTAEARPVPPVRARAGWISAANWLCHGILAVGLVAPSMTYVPRLGEATDVARAAGLVPDPTTYSVLSGIVSLLEHGDVLIGCVLLVFSVVFPISKLIVVRLALRGEGGGAVPPPLLRAVAFASKYSMVDVFVIALLVVASRTMPGGSRIELEWGIFAFCAAALLSTGLTSSVRREAAEAGPRGAE